MDNGSQLWPFYDKSVKLFYVAWTIRKLWALPNTTHCKYLHTINNSLPIDLMLEKRCLKFSWSCINPIRSAGVGGFKSPPPPSDFLPSRI